jgi:hypothetical protein
LQQFIALHHTGVQVRQKAGFGQHPARHFGQVGQRGVVAQCGQCAARRCITQFGLVAQREQGLVAAGRRAGAGYGQNLVRAEVGRGEFLRRLREGAVVAHVAAQLGQRDEHLGRVADSRPVPLVPQAAGCGAQQAEIIAGRQSQRCIRCYSLAA